MANVMWLHDAATGEDPGVGGKAASLARMIAAGLPVPRGFALGTEAYLECRDHSGRTHEMAELLRSAHGSDPAGVATACRELRSIVSTMALSHEVESSVRRAYAELGAQCGDPRLPVAVRSSAVGEDSADASFAGEHDTFLWVRGADDVVDAVRRCWASLFTDRAVSYRAEMGLDHLNLAMGVVVQEMVRPVSAGVAFTLNPTDGDRSVVAIDSSWGFGEAVVSGEVTPDSFLVDKVMQSIVSRVISDKAQELVLDHDDHVVLVEVDPPRATQPSLTDPQVIELAALARRVERWAGCPQDIEWAVVDEPDGASSIVLLQTRPETVWSRMGTDRVPEAPESDRMSSIVTTLISPLHGQQDI